MYSIICGIFPALCSSKLNLLGCAAVKGTPVAQCFFNAEAKNVAETKAER